MLPNDKKCIDQLKKQLANCKTLPVVISLKKRRGSSLNRDFIGKRRGFLTPMFRGELVNVW